MQQADDEQAAGQQHRHRKPDDQLLCVRPLDASMRGNTLNVVRT